MDEGEEEEDPALRPPELLPQRRDEELGPGLAAQVPPCRDEKAPAPDLLAEALFDEVPVGARRAEAAEVEGPEDVGEDLALRERELSHEEADRLRLARTAQGLEDEPPEASRAPRGLVGLDEGAGGHLGGEEERADRVRPHLRDLEAPDDETQQAEVPDPPGRPDGGTPHGRVRVPEEGLEAGDGVRAPDLSERLRRRGALRGRVRPGEAVELAGGRVILARTAVPDHRHERPVPRGALRRRVGPLEDVAHAGPA